MAAVRNAGSPQERQEATVSLAKTLPVSEIGAWLDSGWFDVRDGCELTLFTKILEERWRNEDPAGCLEHALKGNGQSAGAILSEWAVKDPDQALAYLKAHPNANVQVELLQTLSKTHPELVFGQLQELLTKTPGGPLSDYYLSRAFANLAESNPSALEALAASLPSSQKTRVEVALTEVNLKKSFSKELHKLFERSDGLDLYMKCRAESWDGSVGSGDFLKELPNLPPSWMASLNRLVQINAQNARQWADVDLQALGVSAKMAEDLRTQAIVNMAYQDPEGCLERMSSASFSQGQRENVINNMISGVSGDRDKAEALIAKMPSEEDRQIARSSLDAYGSVGANGLEKKLSASEWLAAVQAVDPAKSGELSRYTSMASQWTPQQFAEMGAVFSTMSGDQKGVVASTIINSSRYNSNGTLPVVGEAIKYMIENPAVQAAKGPNGAPDPYMTSQNLMAGSRYAVGLSQSDPDAASAWVGSLPSGDAKLMAEKNLAISWSQYDPDAVDKWVATLPEAEQTAVKNPAKH